MTEHLISTAIEIETPAERVWQILTDFAAYPAWNPFIRSIEGAVRPGARLKVRIQPSGARAMTFRPSVLAVDVGRELRWRGRLLLPGIFDGEHSFVIQPLTAGTTLLRHSERFTGLLVPLLRHSLDRDTKRGFDEMNLALKARAEAEAGS